jgi:hypothetical protein
MERGDQDQQVTAKGRAYLRIRRWPDRGKEKKTMSFTFVQELPTPAEIREEYPLPKAFQELKKSGIRRSRTS